PEYGNRSGHKRCPPDQVRDEFTGHLSLHHQVAHLFSYRQEQGNNFLRTVKRTCKKPGYPAPIKRIALSCSISQSRKRTESARLLSKAESRSRNAWASRRAMLINPACLSRSAMRKRG